MAESVHVGSGKVRLKLVLLRTQRIHFVDRSRQVVDARDKHARDYTEQDAEVQAVILAALGRQGTTEAVARLTRAAEPEGRLFKRKPTALRVSAVQALAEANTPAALTSLKRFADDKERDVRDAAVRALRPKSDS